jgi:ketosteroid isomerase-like protein
MSASDKVELARRLYDAFISRDFAAATELLDPEIELLTPQGTPEEGSYRGYQQARRHLTDLLEPFEDVRVEPKEFIETDDEMVVIVHVSGRGKGSGLPIDTTFAHLLTMRGGRVVRLRAFFDREEALQAAGLR